MNDYIDELETQFSRPATKGSEIEKKIEVVFLLSLLSERQKGAYTNALAQTN